MLSLGLSFAGLVIREPSLALFGFVVSLLLAWAGVVLPQGRNRIEEHRWLD